LRLQPEEVEKPTNLGATRSTTLMCNPKKGERKVFGAGPAKKPEGGWSNKSQMQNKTSGVGDRHLTHQTEQTHHRSNRNHDELKGVGNRPRRI